MKNIYEKHLENLQKIENKGSPFVSIFIPLIGNESPLDKVLSTLIKTADSLLMKENLPRLDQVSIEWEKWRKQGTNTLAIYIGAGVRHIIPLPIRMQPRVIVATSFHIKPLVASSVGHLDSLLLHFNEMGATLYRVNPTTVTAIESYIPSKTSVKGDWAAKLPRSAVREFLDFLKLEVLGAKNKNTKFLGVTGADQSILQMKEFWKDTGLSVVFLDDSFKTQLPFNGSSILKLRLSTKISENFSNSVLKILNASEQSVKEHSLELLGTKILSKEIKNLCVSLEDMHFGELDSSTGETIIRRSQQNVKDDDILDDLVELAIKNGVHISVVPKIYLPAGRSFLAS